MAFKRKTKRASGTFTVEYERDEDGVWVASVKEVQGCHTQAKSIEQARERIREALAAAGEAGATAQLVDKIRMPKELRAAVSRAKRARAGAEVAQAKATRSTVDAAKRLTKQMTVRDAAVVLGISFQRVQQLVEG